jgi:hypothetical protein
MHLDVRVPLGLLFLVLGLILTGFGLMSDSAIYAKSLGQNINVFWGVIFVLFGAVVLVISRKKS